MSGQEFLLYDQTVKLTFTHGGHRYRVSFKEGDKWGESRPTTGVTTILNVLNKPALVPWSAKLSAERFSQEIKDTIRAKKEITIGLANELVDVAKNAPNENRDKAGDAGTTIHQLIETYHVDETEGFLAGEDEEIVKAVEAYIQHFKDNELKAVLVEQPVYSLKYDYAGTLDTLFETPSGKKILNDIKTTKVSKWAPNGVYVEMFAQLGGYAQALSEMFDWLPDQLRITNVGKDGEVRVTTNEDFGMTVEDAIHYWNTIYTTWYTNKDWEYKFKRS